MKNAPLVAIAVALLFAALSLLSAQVAPDQSSSEAPLREHPAGDGDGNLDYGTLGELTESGSAGLIDSVQGSGTR